MKTNFVFVFSMMTTTCIFAQTQIQSNIAFNQEPSISTLQFTTFSSNVVPLHTFFLFFNNSNTFHSPNSTIIPYLTQKNNLFLHNLSSVSFSGKTWISSDHAQLNQKWLFQLSYEQYYIGTLSSGLLTFMLSGNQHHVGKELYASDDRFKAISMLKLSTGVIFTNKQKSRAIILAPFLGMTDLMLQLTLKKFRLFTAPDTQYILFNSSGELWYSNHSIDRFGQSFGIDFTYIHHDFLPEMQFLLSVTNFGLTLQRMANININTTGDIRLTGIQVNQLFDNATLTSFVDSLVEEIHFRQDTSLHYMLLPASIQFSLTPTIQNGITAFSSIRLMPFEKLYHEFTFTPSYYLKNLQIGLPLSFQHTRNLATGLTLLHKNSRFLISWSTLFSFSSSLHHFSGMTFHINCTLAL